MILGKKPVKASRLICILDTSFESKTNPRTQKNFQYTITYALANGKRSR